MIGIRDSGGGRPDSVQLKFQVVDINGTAESGNGLEGVTVEFDLPDIHPSGVEIEPATAVTDADGFATVTLLAGGTPGVVNVNATASVVEGQSLTAKSGTIIIRGGIPSGRGFHFFCAHPIVPAFTSITQGGEYLFGSASTDGTDCSVQLADRVNGVVDLSTQLFFLSEAGTIIQSASTNELGVATTRLGVGPPAPFDVDSPSRGLVTLVAVTRGEEDFYDVDGDKIWDFGLDFQRPEMDLPEPFIDVNDNRAYDEYDEGDFFVEEFRDTDGDGFWTPSNGLWDSDIEIWQTTYVLWVGNIDVADSIPTVSCGPNCSQDFSLTQPCDNTNADVYLAPGGGFGIDWLAMDDNGNCLSGYGEGVYSASVSGDIELVGDDTVEINYDCFEYPLDRRVATKNEGSSFFFVDTSNPNEAAPPPGDMIPPPTISEATVSITYKQINGAKETVSFTYRVCR